MFNRSKSDSNQIESLNIGVVSNLNSRLKRGLAVRDLPEWSARTIKPLLIIGTSLLAIASTQEVKAANFTVVASGLDGPRGITFGLDEALYVAEAGRGGEGACIPSPSIQGAILCYGPTGAISKIDNGTVERVVTGLPSVASLNSVIPDGSDASGPHDIQFDANGTAYVTTGLASDPANRDTLLGISDFGQLLAIDDLNGTSSWTQLADLALYEQDNNPDGDLSPGGVNTNPFYMTVRGETALAIDAGGNDLLSVDLNTGEISLEAVFPARDVPAPDGETIPMQSVPSSVAIGADGAVYVSELTGFPFPQQEANIYRLDDGTPEIFLDGFTNLIDLAFAPSGDLYALEYATNSVLSEDPTGALIQIKPNGDRTTILSEGLLNPTAVAIAPDNSIYISNRGFLQGEGEVLRVEVSTPESTSLLGLFGIAVCGIASQLRSKKTQNNS
jgi:hypothetical protein